jgi:hypothetical protein
MTPVVLIVPRGRTSQCELLAGCFADVPDCQMIVDRRVAERRLGQAGDPSSERRRAERRSRSLDAPHTTVLFVR